MTGPVLAALDLTDLVSSRAVIAEAARQAAAKRLGLLAVAIVPEPFTGLDWRYAIRGTASSLSASDRRQLVADTLQRLEEVVAEATPAEAETETIALLGTVYEQILEEADRREASLIVLAGNRSGAATPGIGANTARVAQYAACSVLILRP